MKITEQKIGESQIILSRGKRHVSIWIQGNRVTAILRINHEDFFQTTATGERWTGKTVEGARKWALKVLAK